MKRAIIAQVLVVLLLTSCATTGRPEALAFTIRTRLRRMVATLSVGSE